MLNQVNAQSFDSYQLPQNLFKINDLLWKLPSYELFEVLSQYFIKILKIHEIQHALQINFKFFSKEIMMLVFKPIFHGGQYSTHGEWFMSPCNDDTFKRPYTEVVFEYKHLYTWLSPGKDLVLNCSSFNITFYYVVQC